MSIGQDLLEEQDDDAGELSYTDKQMAIIEATVNNPDLDVNEIADQTDSHVTYVRSVLDRADPSQVQEILGQATQEEQTEPEPEQEPQAQQGGQASQEPAQTQEPAQQAPQGQQAQAQAQAPQQGIPITLNIPPEAVQQLADAVSQSAGTGGQAEIPQEMTQWFAEEFDVPADRARRIIVRIGTDRAEEMMDERSSPEEIAQEMAQEGQQGQQDRDEEGQFTEQQAPEQ